MEAGILVLTLRIVLRPDKEELEPLREQSLDGWQGWED